jgi:selenocysteine lyase/cysteine desulfurase
MAAFEPNGSSYFLYHSIGVFPDKARRVSEALSALGAIWGTPGEGPWAVSLDIRQQFLERWRELIAAPPGTMTTAENVTTAVHSIMGSLPPRYLKGRKVLIAADCFPSVHFLLSGMGCELETVPLRPGETWVRSEDVIEKWGPDVGVALLTFVTSTASYRCDLPALLAHGRRMGSLVGVDITQGIGIVPFDVRTFPVDFAVSTSLKWLCGVAGAGVIHVREDLLRECQPQLRGWFSQEDLLSWRLDAFQYAPDARRFDHGSPSIFGCAGSLPGLEWLAQQNRDALTAHNRTLVQALIDAAPALRLELVSPREAAERGGSVMFRLPAGPDPAKVVEELRRHDVFADHRGTTLRLSPGNMTTLEGVERFVNAMRRA